MEQDNYKIFLETIKNIDTLAKPKLLLHVCCAPCSSHCLSVLEPYFDITVFFYNPNISPINEYHKRLDEEKRFLELAHKNVKFVETDYDNQKFEEMAKGLENLQEGGERCKKCYTQRLQKTAEYAKQNGYDYFCTTLSVSPYKSSKVLNEIGGQIAQSVGIKYLFSDFKKQNGYQHSIEISHQYGLYRQNYCGCRFSKLSREKADAEHNDKS